MMQWTAACAAFGLCLLIVAPPRSVLSQAPEAAPQSEGDEGTDVGSTPAGALVGCNSPYTYLEANSRANLSTFHSLVEGDPDVKDAMKYRNTTATLLLPTDAAFDKLQASTGLDVLAPGALTTSLLQAILEYHTLLEPIDPTTLAAQAGPVAYDTALSVDASGANAKTSAPTWELFARNPALTYVPVTITTTAIPAGTAVEAAPLGTFKVTGAASEANIIWDSTYTPVRTCTGFIYLLDGVLLPSANLAALGAGGEATAPLAAAGESEGASVETPVANSG